jgi:hypothetical protein
MPSPRRRFPATALAVSLAAALLAFAPPAWADRLELNDGRIVDGQVVKEGDVYRVTSRFGESTVPVKDVKTWTVAKTVDAEWRERLVALKPGDHAGRAALAKWLLGADRPEAARATAKQVLEADPENAVAHDVLGHVRHKGVWMTPEEAKAAEGLVRRGDRWYTPEEWAILDAAAKSKAEEAERAEKGKRVTSALNDAVRLALAPDAKLRQEGLERIKALAKETQSAAIEGLVPQVLAFAEANDRMSAALARGSAETATVLTECRIQLARLKRPIQNFETSLSSNLSTAPVRIQLPELEVISVNSTVLIPATVTK